MKEQIEQLKQWVEQCGPGKMVFLGGAGVSTESGIPDFRSSDGLYSLNYKYPPEQIISASFFAHNTAEFYRFYADKMLITDKLPNAAHLKLAQLEEQGTLCAVVTQNIDGLHQQAGSKNVLELHGSIHRNYCMSCDFFMDAEELRAAYKSSADGIARCPQCGGVMKPDVVLYEEALDQRVLRESIESIARAELMVIAGTSLSVYPAASLMDYFRGDHLAIVNLSPTPRDRSADLCIQGKVGEVFSQL